MKLLILSDQQLTLPLLDVYLHAANLEAEKAFPLRFIKMQHTLLKFEKPKDILGFNQLPLMLQWPFVIVNHIASLRSQIEKLLYCHSSLLLW